MNLQNHKKHSYFCPKDIKVSGNSTIRNLKTPFSNKAQIITFDLVFSLVLFIILVVLFTGMYLLSRQSQQEYDYELDYIFSNFENNLFAEPSPNGVDIDFFRNFRIDKNKLENFVVEFDDNTININEYILGNVGSAHGIGISTALYDSCLYFVDNDNSRLEFNTVTNTYQAIGNLKSGSCHDIIIASGNPCDNYKQGISFLKPVLLDEGNPNQNRVIQMNIVLCKK